MVFNWPPPFSLEAIVPHAARPRPEAFNSSISLPPGRALDICSELQSAIFEHRIIPGTKLSEDEVGEIFGASRTIVRSALQALAHSGLVEIKRNRGAFVAEPTVGDAHEVFEARALIEPEIAKRAVNRVSARQLTALQSHIAAEHVALAEQNMGRALALSGMFHLTIADIAGHRVYANMLQSLITKSSLIIALYSIRSDAACESHSHHALLGSFEKRDGDAAKAIMRSHLVDLHSGLNLQERRGTQISLAEALAGA